MTPQPKFRAYARRGDGRWHPVFTGDLAEETLAATRMHLARHDLDYTKIAVLRRLPGDPDWILGVLDDAAVMRRLVTMYVPNPEGSP